jgi:hypothetical protein
VSVGPVVLLISIFYKFFAANLNFTLFTGERDGTYDNYNEIRRATLAGHDMEVVVFLEGCDVIEGEPIQATGVVSFKSSSVDLDE